MSKNIHYTKLEKNKSTAKQGSAEKINHSELVKWNKPNNWREVDDILRVTRLSRYLPLLLKLY